MSRLEDRDLERALAEIRAADEVDPFDAAKTELEDEARQRETIYEPSSIAEGVAAIVDAVTSAPSGNLPKRPRRTAPPTSTTRRRRKPTSEIFFKCTDLGNAERLVAQHGQDLKFCAKVGWLAWDGRRWRQDDTGERVRRAKMTVRGIYVEAAAIDDENMRKAVSDHARKSESRDRINAMVALAESDERIVVRAADLDTDPFALNVENGTIDLRTGKLRPHNPGDLITKLAPVAFNQVACAPIFEAFLATIFAGKPELAAFVQRYLGYCLTGDVREQVLVFFYGEGKNGKSTLIEIVLFILGEYAMTAAPGLLLAKKNDTHPTEQADLFGARFVASVEIGEGKRLDEETLKRLTGGDTIKARYMGRDFFDFRPTHKLLVATNSRPEVRGTDTAIWRRLLLALFDVTIPDDQVDKDLPSKLRAEAPGILAWLVDGCLEWQAEGLRPPACVLQATAEYRAEQDQVGRFIADKCFLNERVTSGASDLYETYQAWAEELGEHPTSQKKFGAALGKRGLTSIRQPSGRMAWVGIGLYLTEPSEPSEPKIRSIAAAHLTMGHDRIFHSNHSDGSARPTGTGGDS